MIGQRLALQGDYEGKSLKNKFGVCVASNNFRDNPSYLMVIEDWKSGHDGYGAVPDEFADLVTGRNCWWVADYNIKTLTKSETQSKQELIINKIKYLDKKFKERKHHVTR